MDFLEIKKYPQKILRQKCEPIKEMTDHYRKLFRLMLATMDEYQGIGLAAPQVGINQMLIVAHIGNEYLELANPEVIEAGGRDIKEEGCLSIPDMMVDVNRAYEVMVRGINDKGETVEMRAEGLWARVLQHEIDHLHGRLIIDHMKFFSRMKFKMKRRLCSHAYVRV
ncbi:MAG: peptide deformylase [Candidatus Omnitrophica bacterium]|nr:peptide deformylase [Candidatus Omnitrophota bacterium]